ncbi:unnamed protein product [Schistocephalus solidus]|uniref:Uncharacterized protein n=1 Tax=Schistocephalus solidus TaxID=70667 RepID=A0A183SH32_SCHSO|nr:unnamed protein product [Schistocephalus solidus]
MSETGVGLVTIALIILPLIVIVIFVLASYLHDSLHGTGLSGSKVEVVEQLLFGGSDYLRNVVVLAITISQIFSPNLLLESMYVSRLQAISLIIGRTMSFALCVFFWNRISSMGFQSIGAYLMHRYENQYILALYYMNSVLGALYIYNIYAGPVIFGTLEQLKSNRAFFLVLIGYVSICSFGGMRTTLVTVCILWVMEYIGKAMLVQHTYTAGTFDLKGIESEHDMCKSSNPLTSFVGSFCLLMAVQPGYTVFHAAESPLTSKISMAVGLLLFWLNSVGSIFSANALKAFGHKYELNGTRWLYGLLRYPKGPNDQQKAFIHSQVFQTKNVSSYMDEAWNLDSSDIFVFVTCVYFPLAAFFCLRVTILSGEISEKFVPHLLRSAIIRSGSELQRMYTALHACLWVIVLSGLIVWDKHVQLAETRPLNLFEPHYCAALLPGSALIIAFGSLFPQAKLVPLALAWLISLALSGPPIAMYLWSTEYEDVFHSMVDWRLSELTNWDCLGAWSLFLQFFLNFALCLILSAVFGGIRNWFQQYDLKYMTYGRQPSSFTMAIHRPTQVRHSWDADYFAHR